MMILLSGSGERGSIVIGMIADDVFLGVLGPTPVEVVVEDEMKLGAARLAAYDVEEEIEAEVEHLEHVEALHERDLEQTLIVDENEYHLRNVARRDGQKQKERDEYEENRALFELTIAFGQRVIRWSTRLILLLLLIIIIKKSCVSIALVSFACSLMMIVGLYERVELGLLTRQQCDQEHVEDEQQTERYERVEENVVDEHVGAKVRASYAHDQMQVVVDHVVIDERWHQVGYVDDHDQYNHYAQQSQRVSCRVELLALKRKLKNNISFDRQQDEQPNANVPARDGHKQGRLAPGLVEREHSVVHDDGEQPLGQAQRVRDRYDAEVVTHGRVAERARHLKVRERDEIEHDAEREQDRAGDAVHVELDQIELFDLVVAQPARYVHCSRLRRLRDHRAVRSVARQRVNRLLIIV